MIFALIPAAGKSTRMGRPKLALPLGGKTILEHVISAQRAAEIEHIVVVVGPHVPELVPLAQAAGAEAVLLTDETAEMRATVEHGLRWLQERYHPTDEDAWLLVPADHPTLDASVVQQLVQARRARPELSIFIPAFQNKRGHPALIGWRHVTGMRLMPAGLGINAYLRGHAAETLELQVSSADSFFDLDTPDDYERLKDRWQRNCKAV